MAHRLGWHVHLLLHVDGMIRLPVVGHELLGPVGYCPDLHVIKLLKSDWSCRRIFVTEGGGGELL